MSDKIIEMCDDCYFKCMLIKYLDTHSACVEILGKVDKFHIWQIDAEPTEKQTPRETQYMKIYLFS